MKKNLTLFLSFLCAVMVSSLLGNDVLSDESPQMITRGGNCSEALLIRLVQDVLNNTNIIKPQVTSILNNIGDGLDCDVTSVIDDIAVVDSKVDVVISLIDEITISSINDQLDSKLDVIDAALSQCCENLNSKLDILDDEFSASDALINSKLDVIDNEISVNDGIVNSKLDVVDAELSQCCETLNSKVGDLDSSGSVLDSQIDYPADINNLDLSVVQLLKTILLELRGQQA